MHTKFGEIQPISFRRDAKNVKGLGQQAPWGADNSTRSTQGELMYSYNNFQ